MENRYKAENSSFAPRILDTETDVILLDVTSYDYAKFLARKLNEGMDLSDLYKRPVPDLEYSATLLSPFAAI